MDVAALEPSYDSSDGLEDDDDWDRTQFTRNANHGKRQAMTIIARQAEDRAISKRNARRLTMTAAAPCSQYAIDRVQETWDAFYTSIGFK